MALEVPLGRLLGAFEVALMVPFWGAFEVLFEAFYRAIMKRSLEGCVTVVACLFFMSFFLLCKACHDLPVEFEF